MNEYTLGPWQASEKHGLPHWIAATLSGWTALIYFGPDELDGHGRADVRGGSVRELSFEKRKRRKRLRSMEPWRDAGRAASRPSPAGAKKLTELV
jgi:hypothetical protein